MRRPENAGWEPARRPAQAHALVGLHERAIDQDRVRQHRIQQRLVAHGRVAQAQLFRQGFLAAQRIAHAQAGAPDHVAQLGARGRRGQVVDHLRLEAGSADRGQRIARATAARVVENRDVHPHILPGSKRTVAAGQRFMKSFYKSARMIPASPQHFQLFHLLRSGRPYRMRGLLSGPQ
jgi:hypothetical protein